MLPTGRLSTSAGCRHQQAALPHKAPAWTVHPSSAHTAASVPAAHTCNIHVMLIVDLVNGIQVVILSNGPNGRHLEPYFCRFPCQHWRMESCQGLSMSIAPFNWRTSMGAAEMPTRAFFYRRPCCRSWAAAGTSPWGSAPAQHPLGETPAPPPFQCRL